MKTYIKFLCITVLLAVMLSTAAQTSLTSDGKSFLIKNYSAQNGLLDNDIYSIAQDKNGYIWIGSSLGLTRFDGKTFFHKAIPEIYDNPTIITSIATSSEGAIFTTAYLQGIFAQQDDGQFKKYLDENLVEVGKKLFKSVKSCADNSILANTSRSIFKIEGDSMRQIYEFGSALNIFNDIDIDKDNRIWFGGRLGLGMLQTTETGFEPLFFPELRNKLIVAIFFDDEGALHVATIQGYYRISWRQPALWDSDYIIEQPFPQLKDIYINRIYIDKERNLWIPTDSYGVFRTKGDSITLHLTKENGLLSSSVMCMLQDKEGIYWFATTEGISMVKDFDNYAIENNGVRFKEPKEFTADEFQRIWMYSRSALFAYQDDTLIPFNLSGTPLEVAGIRLIEINSAEMLISNDVGLYRIPISNALPDMRKIELIARYADYGIMALMHDIKTDSAGVWICSATKICNYANRQFVKVKFNHPDSVSLSPRRMIRDKYGYYWCADYTNGIYRGTVSRPDKDNMVFDIVTVHKSYKPDSSFVTTLIRDMTFDREGNLWFSSLNTGVYKLSIDKNGALRTYNQFFS